MKVLVVDIGNTDIKFGVFEHGRLLQYWRASGTRTKPDGFAALLMDNLSAHAGNIQAVAYSSVVPVLENVFRETLTGLLHLTSRQFFSPASLGTALPLDFSRYATGQLGLDRLANVCGGRRLFPVSNLVVVSFGTATTFDIINVAGVYLGGAIAPGLITMGNSLSENTAQLPTVSLVGKQYGDLGLGTSTQASMEAGIGLGYRGLMRELLDTCAKALDGQAFETVATGGLADSVIALCGLEARFSRIDPTLTLKGLASLHEFSLLRR